MPKHGNSKIKITPDDFINLLKSGKLMSQIATDQGVTVPAIYNFAKRSGIDNVGEYYVSRANKKITLTADEILNLIDAGHKVREIATDQGVSATAIYKHLETNGINMIQRYADRKKSKKLDKEVENA